MTYQLTFSKKHDYLHAKVTGQNSIENVKQYLDELSQICTDTNCLRLLIEEQLEGPRLDTLSVFQIAVEGSLRVHGRFEAIAYVDLNAEGPLMQFAETVAVNRALPVRVFRTVAEAEKWLLQGK